MHGEVEVHCLVHDLGVADLNNRVQEQIIIEGRGVLGHNLDCIVSLLIRHVQVDRRFEQTSTLASTDNLGHIELAEEDLAVLHDLFWDVLGVENTKFSEDTNVSILETKALLEQ